MVTFIHLTQDKSKKVILNKSGDYVIFFHNISGELTFILNEKNINLDIFGLFTGRNEDQFNIQTIQHHKAPAATSNLLIKGIFDGKSRFNYEGLIRIEKKAQKSHAYQKNQNLLLSPNTYIESKPFLEILANDVFCTHGSTTGKLNEDELYYAQTRGLSRQQSQELLVAGFIEDMFEKIRQSGVSNDTVDALNRFN